MQRLPTSAGPDAIFDAFKKDGIVVIEGFLNVDQIQRFGSEIQPAMDKLAAGPKDGFLDKNSFFYELLGNKTKRLAQLVTESTVFRQEIFEHQLMHELLEKVFVEGPSDGYWLNACEVIEIEPGSKAQPIHRDQELYPVWNSAGAALPEAICTFISALTPFTALNGATQVAPGSHLDTCYNDFLDPNFKDCSDPKTIPATMNPGDCIFFSGKILHGGGANQTSDEFRRGLAMSFIRKILMPEQAHPLCISHEIADTMTYRGQAMLGFRSKWPVAEGEPEFSWSYGHSDIGRHIGLKDKTPGSRTS